MKTTAEIVSEDRDHCDTVSDVTSAEAVMLGMMREPANASQADR